MLGSLGYIVLLNRNSIDVLQWVKVFKWVLNEIRNPLRDTSQGHPRITIESTWNC